MKFIVIGDIMVDQTVYGEVRKISPEAPIPVIECKETRYVLGGAANVAKNVVALGHEVIMCGYTSMISTQLFDQHPSIDTKYTIYKGLDNVKLRYVDNKTGYQLLRADNEDEIKSYGPIENDLWKDIDTIEADALIISDYNKGVIGDSISELIEKAKGRGIPVFVDTRRDLITPFEGVNWIMPNAKELAAILEWHGSREEIEIIEDFQLEGMVVTLSENGMYLVTKNFTFSVDATQKNVVDVTGAGDTALATFAVEIASGSSPEKALRKANENAGLVCLKRGTATI